MRISPRQLNRATLARQLLLERRRLPVITAIRQLLALQAQEPASPYLALWSRLRDFDPADLDAAFGSNEVVKATLMRITLHAVAADDRAVLRLAMRPTLRSAGLADRRFTATGRSIEDADALVAELVGFAAEPRTRKEIEGYLAERTGAAPVSGLWRALRMISPLVHAPVGRPWSFDRSARYVALPGDLQDVDAVDATAQLIQRYLKAFGPASRKDFAQFTKLRHGDTRPAWERVRGDLVTMESPSGTTLYDLPHQPIPDEDVTAPPRLLPMWDSVLLAYADRSRIIPERYRRHLIRRNGDVLPTVLVDGSAAGAWRHVDGGIEVAAFHAFDDEDWDGLATEAQALTSFLAARDDNVFGRHGHWWSKLPGAQIVRLSG